MSHNGWKDGDFIYVVREIKDKPWAKTPHRFALWMHFLLRAAWKRHLTRFRGQNYDLHPGEFPTTIRQLAEETGLSRGTVERDIVWYKTETMIETKSTGGSTLIKILNWHKYQPGETKSETNLGQSLGQGSGTLQNKGIRTEEGESEEEEKKPSVKKIQPSTEEEGKTNSLPPSRRITFNPEIKKFQGILQEDIQRWSDAYPAVEISLAIKQAAEWRVSNPSKQKKNNNRFLVNWFGREQEKGGGRAPREHSPSKTPQVPKVLESLSPGARAKLEEYRKTYDPDQFREYVELLIGWSAKGREQSLLSGMDPNEDDQ